MNIQYTPTGAGSFALAHALRVNQTLTELNLRETRTVNLIALRNQVPRASRGDEAILAIGESLKVNQTLQKLDLGVWFSITVVNCFIYNN